MRDLNVLFKALFKVKRVSKMMEWLFIIHGLRLVREDCGRGTRAYTIKKNVIIQKMCSMGEWLHYSYIKQVSAGLPLLPERLPPFFLVDHRLVSGMEGVNYSCNLYRNKA